MNVSLTINCPLCQKPIEANLAERANFIERYGCDSCRFDEKENQMPKAEPKKDPKTPKTHKLPKGDGQADDLTARLSL